MPSLVLIPGLLCDARLWGEQTAALWSDARIVVADIRRQASIAEMAAAVLADSPDRFSLAGFSLGSQVALEIIRDAPARVGRLALLSATHGGLLPPVEAAIRHAVAKIENEGLGRYLEEAYPSYVAEGNAGDGAIKRTFIEMAESVGKEAGLRQMQSLLAIKTPFSGLAQIRCPTLILGGSEDHRTTPEAHRLLAQEIPGSELILIEGAGHFTPLERPGAVTEALRNWLKR